MAWQTAPMEKQAHVSDAVQYCESDAPDAEWQAAIVALADDNVVHLHVFPPRAGPFIARGVKPDGKAAKGEPRWRFPV